VVAAIILEARELRGWQVFDDLHRLEALKRATTAVWASVDLLAVPTAPRLPTVEEALADPRGPNLRLGTYTNFVNLLDLAAVALPAGRHADGSPAGTSLVAPGGHDALLLDVAAVIQP
jgi:allophanate hydrolase